ncbi:outer membrane beta-barrel protein [Catenovulum agarivorans]|uniref:outer membrane beta-barrel protein n=1 Tax=Catenovulum agarivorans TaxID=1172192 RepID=UPI000300BC17|nr:outer membrane beta-barrel protein [Catenovulum agarivorans]
MKTVSKISLAIALSLTSTSIFANQSKTYDKTGWYVGVLAGQVKNHSADGLGQAGLYGGYHFTEWFGLEQQYWRSEEIGNTDMAFSSLDIAPKFSLQLSSFVSLYVKAGVSFTMLDDGDYDYDDDDDDDDHDWDWWDISNQDSSTLARPAASSRTSQYLNSYDEWSGFTWNYGFGVQVYTPAGINIALAYEQYEGEISGEYSYSPDLNIDMQSVSVRVHYQF